jgi:hypothetical protein
MGNNNTKNIKKHPGGRPTKLNDEVVKKLENIFKVGGTVEEACAYAGISKPTYYAWLKEDESFLTKMEAAQHYADIVAKNLVVKAITEDKDLESAKWWLDRRVFKNQPIIQANTQINVFGQLKQKYGQL